jgi:diguanylate cyclase
MVSAVVGLGRSLGLRVVAEGVETPDQLAFLEAHQCDEAQGYYFSRPVPAQQSARLLSIGILGPSGHVVPVFGRAASAAELPG